jgi:hypothetical protein
MPTSVRAALSAPIMKKIRLPYGLSRAEAVTVRAKNNSHRESV